jgi:esterase/lipase superfamily enzyme
VTTVPGRGGPPPITTLPAPPGPPPVLPSTAWEGDKTHAIISVFYATDRSRATSTDQLVSYGGNREPNESLHLGRFDVSIPKAAHETGQLERPSIWSLYRENPDKHITIVRRFEQSYETFYGELSKLVADSKRKQIFVFVHGYNVGFEDAVYRTAQLAYDLRFDGAPIVYSWPSVSEYVGYPTDANNAEWTIPHLRWFLEDVATKTQADAVHVIAHSMGNRPVVAALNRIAMESAPSVRSKFGQVALTAPDIDAAVFRQLAATLTRAAQRVTLYASGSDRALQASQRFQGYQRAGDTNPNVVVVNGIETIDVSATDTDLIGIGHSYYGDRKSVLADLFYLIKEGLSADRRAGLDAVGQPPSRYWVFVR